MLAPRRRAACLFDTSGTGSRRIRQAAGVAPHQAASPLALPICLQDGICVTGYLTSEIGLGQAARSLAYACDAARLPFSLRDLPLPGRQSDAEFRSNCNPLADRKVNLLVTGLASLPWQLDQLAPGRLNVLCPFWYLPHVPAAWWPSIRECDEIWAPSRFVATRFAAELGRPVQLVPQAVRVPRAMPPPCSGRRQLRFLTDLDFDSFVQSKNPKAAIEAFRAAFPPVFRDVELMVKTRGTLDCGLRHWLGEIAAQDPRISILDRICSRSEMDDLIAVCDAFISLHRSEGFGSGAAEALAAGKAVVATDYSGTTDLINDQTGYPVAFDLAPVEVVAYLAAEVQVWANPRHDAAVAALRQIAADPDHAEIMARRGFALLRHRHAPEAVGRLVTGLLRHRGMV